MEDPEGKPVIDRGPEGAWDHVAVDNPFIYIEDGAFYCFYEGENERRQEQVGIAVPRDARGEPAAIIEISPLLANEPEDLVGKVPTDLKIKPGDKVYLE